jgi:pimeloyl-ACP methyl ester carboxylesterase
LSAPSRPPYGSARYAEWLDDVLGALSVPRAAFVGISLGGWLAIDYATRRPDRVTALVLLAPGGVGRETTSALKLLFVVLPLLACGAWGRRRALTIMLGAPNAEPTPMARAVDGLMDLILKHFRQNLAKVSRFGDEQLRALVMPVLLIVGARDAMLASAETRRRLEAHVAGVEVRWLENVGHAVVGQTAPILEFLRKVLPN